MVQCDRDCILYNLLFLTYISVKYTTNKTLTLPKITWRA